jgi:hypothetical protein
MKRLNITIILATVLLLAGCKKTNTDMQNDVSDNIPITSQSTAKQVAYAEGNLRKIGAEIAKLAKDDDFVNFVRTEARKKFDSEYEVLISDLKKNSIWASKLNSPNLNEGLAAFRNIGGISGYNFYPQIFIPKFQHDEESNNSSLSQYDSIKVVFYGGSTGNEESLATASYPAYSIDSAGLLHYWGIVDENYANENEVWVFSLSESVDAQGRLILPCSDDDPCGGGGGTGGGGTGGGGTGGGGTNPDIDPVPTIPHPRVNDPTHALVNCQIEHMRVNVFYESWLAGKSEVSIRAVLHCHNNRALGFFNQFEEHYDSDQKNGNSYLGRLIRKFTRKEIRNGNIILVNYPLQIGWQLWMSIVTLFFLIMLFLKEIIGQQVFAVLQ